MQLPFDAPTVEITLEVSTPSGHGWTWVRCETCPPAPEFVYSANELCQTMLAYGALGAVTMPAETYERFRLIARGLPAQCMLGEYVWLWEAQEARYRPESPPWIRWPAMADLPTRVARGARLLGYTGLEPRCPLCTS